MQSLHFLGSDIMFSTFGALS